MLKHKLNLQNFIEGVIQNKLCIYHVNVIQHGECISTFDFRDNRRDNIHSCSKSITSLAVGIGIEEGVISLDDKPAEIFPEKLPKNPSPYLMDITVRDMMKMATGHDYFILQGYTDDPKLPGRNDLTNPDWIKYAFSFDVPYKPGTYFKYNNFGPFLASAIIQKLTGERLVDYLKPRFFDHLDIKNPQWEETPLGRTIGTGGLMLSCEEMARVGQVFLDGSYNGKQIVSKEYIKEATSCLIDNSKGSKDRPDYQRDAEAGYGYWFWRCSRDNAYTARGWGGQLIICLPEQDAVIAINSHEFESQKILDCVWDNIIPLLKEYK